MHTIHVSLFISLLLGKEIGNTEQRADVLLIHTWNNSLEEAKKTDGIFKKMGFRLKQAIWI